MASIKDDKEERDDSDGEDMDRDSDSDKSSTTTDSSDASDSDDSAEMDAEECERRRNELVDKLSDLEKQYATLREQLYRERIMQVKIQLEEVHDGTAKEYRQPLEDLQQNMKKRIEVAGVLRKLRLENIDNNFKAEELAAKQNFENEKLLLFDGMKEDLEEKIRRLDEDRNSIDFQNDIFSSEKGKKQGKIWKKKSSDNGRKKPVTVTGPYIVYMLSDADILDDWTLIRKSLTKKQVDRKYSRCYSRTSISSRIGW